MPLALGLLLMLPLVGALHRSNEIFVLPRNETSLTADEKNSSVKQTRGFSITKIFPEGEIRRIIRWKGICARETIVDWGDTNVVLREVSLKESGRKLQLIYEGEELTDCTEVKLANDEDEDDCSSEMRTEIYRRNIEARIEILGNSDGVEENKNSPGLRWFASTRELRNRCIDLKKRARKQLMAQRRHRRIERSLQQMVIAPGTKWCGPHRTANTYKELGGLDHVDRCCRRHDHCYRSIPPFSERYNLWNYMPFTLSHCGCDQSFRTCLKMAGTSSANFIGRIFFNVVQTKCFVLKPQKVCTRQSWWGKCEKHEYRKQAHLRDNVPY